MRNSSGSQGFPHSLLCCLICFAITFDRAFASVATDGHNGPASKPDLSRTVTRVARIEWLVYSSDGSSCFDICFIISPNERSPTTMLSYQTFESGDTFFLGRWNKSSFFLDGANTSQKMQRQLTGQNGSPEAYLVPTSSPSSFSLWFLVNSSITFDTNFTSAKSVPTTKSNIFNWRRFWRPRGQK